MSQRKTKRAPEGLLSILLIVLVMAIAYLPLIGQLGYYGDDWHIAWGGYTEGPQKIVAINAVDRPFLGYVSALAYRVLGDAPLPWHLYAFGLRLAGVLVLFWLARMLWPGRRVATTAMALLFGIYPGFLLESLGRTYQTHFTGILFGLLSVALTVRAVLEDRLALKLLLLALAALAALGSFLMFEWFIGYAFVCGILLFWLVFARGQGTARQKLIRAILHGLPVLAALGAFLFWRTFIFVNQREVTSVQGLAGMYLSSPVGMLSRLVIETARDWVETTVLAWGVPLYQRAWNASYADIAISVLLALAGVAGFLLYARSVKEETAETGWRWVLPAAAACILVALVPAILANRDVRFDSRQDRYTLVAMMAVAFLVVALVYTAARPAWRAGLVAVFLALGILTQYHAMAASRDAWAAQRQLWWQLSWRAPQLQPGTVLMPLLPSGDRLSDDYEVWAPGNLLYFRKQSSLGVVGDVLNGETAWKLAEGAQDERNIRTIYFKRDYTHALIASLPSLDACLHVLDGQSPELSSADDPLVVLAAPYSKIAQIDPSAPRKTPLSTFFGGEPPRGWCYDYQKASLARQQGDWQAVAALGDEAARLGLLPADPVEWLPFYEGYRQTGQAEKAAQVAAKLRANPSTLAILCARAPSSGWKDLCANQQ